MSSPKLLWQLRQGSPAQLKAFLFWKSDTRQQMKCFYVNLGEKMNVTQPKFKSPNIEILKTTKYSETCSWTIYSQIFYITITKKGTWNLNFGYYENLIIYGSYAWFGFLLKITKKGQAFVHLCNLYVFILTDFFVKFKSLLFSTFMKNLKYIPEDIYYFGRIEMALHVTLVWVAPLCDEWSLKTLLPSFSGNIPAALKKIFPSANITRLGNWNSVDSGCPWSCTYLLDPSDPLFVEIGEAFIRRQVKEYGDVTDIYNCSQPWLHSYGAYLYLFHYGPLIQIICFYATGWLFSSDSAYWKPPQMKALLHAVPFGKMIVLDLFAEVKPIWKNSSQFYGTPYVWCMLHNFGGNIEMYGTLDSISSGPVDARISENSSMVGVGMCMEGIEHNPVVYELMSEMAFGSEKVQVLEWLKSYSHRRYGKAIHQVEAAWEILYHTIYNCTDGIEDQNTDFIVKFPDWDPSNTSSALPQAHLWYSTKKVINALRLFIDAGNNFAGSLTYRYDLVDLTRQVLSKLANQEYLDAVIAFRQKDLKALNLHSKKFIQIIKDIDILLASDDNFLLGTWLKSANKLAKNPHELRQYEWNARTQVTMWFDNTRTLQSNLHDYANKFWSGLLEGYYLPGASTYFDYLLRSLREKENFKLKEW
ncbi:alpha-N-acetylglucosaminidase isoform X4 [Fagus crenata]